MMNFNETIQFVVNNLKSSASLLQIDPNSIFLEGDFKGNVLLSEQIILAMYPNETFEFENTTSKFWKCTLDFSVYSLSVSRSFEMIQQINKILQTGGQLYVSNRKVQVLKRSSQGAEMKLSSSITVESS